ncbi:MAG: hypothetical protein GXZ02_00310 [Clostridiales bacterium]|nr:hypothetical protein [Clostridiales bacterium]
MENEETSLVENTTPRVKKKNKKSLLIGSAAIIIVVVVIVALIAGYIAGKPTAQAGSVYDGSSVLTSYYNSTTTTAESLSEMYGFSTGDAESLRNDKPAWKAYSFEVEVKNKSKEPISISAFDVKNNGKDNIWLQIKTAEKIDIIAGNTPTILITALVNGREITAETAMQEIKKFSIKIMYSKTPTTSPDGKESIETSKTIRVK